VDEYHQCCNCGYITFGFDGYIEMMKHTQQCKKKSSTNSDGIKCLFNTYRGD